MPVMSSRDVVVWDNNLETFMCRKYNANQCFLYVQDCVLYIVLCKSMGVIRCSICKPLGVLLLALQSLTLSVCVIT